MWCDLGDGVDSGSSVVFSAEQSTCPGTGYLKAPFPAAVPTPAQETGCVQTRHTGQLPASPVCVGLLAPGTNATMPTM